MNKKKSNKEKKISDNLIFWISILGFILAVISFFQNSSYKLLIIAIAMSLSAVCAIVFLFKAVRSDERAKQKDKRINQIKKEISEGKVPSDSYFFKNKTKDKKYIIDTLFIKAHVLFDASSDEWGVKYTWKANCHLSIPNKSPKSLSSQIAGDYPITDINSLNVKAFIKNSNKQCPMNVDIESVDLKTKNLNMHIPPGFFCPNNRYFTYTLSYTWPRSYRPPKDKFSFFIQKENNQATYETHIKIVGNKQCFSSAFFEIIDEEFKTSKTRLSISTLKNNEIGVTLDISKGTKEKMVYIETRS